MMKRLISISLVIVLGYILTTSCSSSRKVVYLQDIQANVPMIVQKVQTIRLQPNDKLNIVIHGHDKELVQMFNLLDGTGQGNGNHLLYTIDEKGYIDMPVLGPIKAEGLTRQELATTIKYRLIESELIRNPTVVVEYSNLGYYFLGEISGRKPIERDHVTLLEALSEAGDLPLTATRDNILVLRTEKGVQTPYRVSLLNVKDLYSSPVYYIQQNDIIYIEPILVKRNQTNIHGSTFYTYGFWTSMASFLMSLVMLITK